MAGVVGKNIGAIIEMRAKEERKKSFQDRIADALTTFLEDMSVTICQVVPLDHAI